MNLALFFIGVTMVFVGGALVGYMCGVSVAASK